MSHNKIYFKVLGIAPTTDKAVIKKAYRKLVVLYHPDKVMHLDKQIQRGSKEMFQKINDAYDYLKDKKGFK